MFGWRRGGGEWHSRDGWFITGLLNWQKMLFSFKSLSNFNFIGFRAIFRSTMHGFLNSFHQLQYYNKLIMLFIIRYGAIKEPELILLFWKYATNTCFFSLKMVSEISPFFKSFHIPTYLLNYSKPDHFKNAEKEKNFEDTIYQRFLVKWQKMLFFTWWW